MTLPTWGQADPYRFPYLARLLQRTFCKRPVFPQLPFDRLRETVHGVEIMQLFFVTVEERACDPNLLAKAALALETNLAFHGKVRQVGSFFLLLTEAAD